MNRMQAALIKKDISSITANKRLFTVMWIIPLFMAVVIPSILILIAALAPLESNDFQEILMILPAEMLQGDLKLAAIDLILNNIIPIFFMLIPIMASSVMAASSFVGEKEKRTLETLLYCPLSLRQIFQAKILAAFILSMAVSLISFVLMVIVTGVEIWFTLGTLILPGTSWLVLMLMISPAISMVAITFTVRGSAKAQTVEESQQQAVYLVLPVILFMAGQFTGILLVNAGLLLGLGVVLAVIAVVMMRGAFRSFDYEGLLR